METCFRNEEEHHDEVDAQEDGADPFLPSPSDTFGESVEDKVV